MYALRKIIRHKLSEAIGRTKLVPITVLTASRRAMMQTMNDIDHGSLSQTPGPIEIWKTEKGNLQVVDGYHRLFELLLMGIKKVKIKIRGEGYTDYWADAADDDQFGFDLTKKYGGLEDLADEEILQDLLDNNDMTYSGGIV